jgi:hypothetical protein
MREAARTSETCVGNYFTRQYIPKDKSELHTRCRENLKSHAFSKIALKMLNKILQHQISQASIQRFEQTNMSKLISTLSQLFVEKTHEILANPVPEECSKDREERNAHSINTTNKKEASSAFPQENKIQEDYQTAGM